MQIRNTVAARHPESVLATNSVLRNTYILLGLTLVFSGVMAGIAMATNARPMSPMFTIILYFGLFFITTRLSTSAWGLLAIFALTGFMGYTLGPILNMFIHNYANGTSIVMTSLGATGLIFFVLSGYALTTRKDFSYMGGFLAVAVMVAFLGGIAGLFFHMPALQLMVSAAFVLISSGFILFQTSQIINGGERNYIIATIGLYVSLYNLFISLLSIFGALGGNRN
jgi:modulator of FtsH protease